MDVISIQNVRTAVIDLGIFADHNHLLEMFSADEIRQAVDDRKIRQVGDIYCVVVDDDE